MCMYLEASKQLRKLNLWIIRGSISKVQCQSPNSRNYFPLLNNLRRFFWKSIKKLHNGVTYVYKSMYVKASMFVKIWDILLFAHESSSFENVKFVIRENKMHWNKTLFSHSRKSTNSRLWILPSGYSRLRQRKRRWEYCVEGQNNADYSGKLSVY